MAPAPRAATTENSDSLPEGSMILELIGPCHDNRLSEDLVSIFSEFPGGRKSGAIFGGWYAEELEDVALEVGQLGDKNGLVRGITSNRMALNVLKQVDRTAGRGTAAGGVPPGITADFPVVPVPSRGGVPVPGAIRSAGPRSTRRACLDPAHLLQVHRRHAEVGLQLGETLSITG